MSRFLLPLGTLLLAMLLGGCQAEADRSNASESGAEGQRVFEARSPNITAPAVRNAGQVLMQLQAPADGAEDYRLLIDAAGEVQAVRTGDGQPTPPDDPNARLLRQLNYEPARREGHPVAVWTSFRLEGGQ